MKNSNYQTELEHTIGILLQQNPFFAFLIHQFSISWTLDMPTAAVRVSPKGTMEMFINPEFFSSLTDKERVGLVLHELYHIVNGHLSRYLGLTPDEANIAMDIAINQYIPSLYLPPGALMPDNVIGPENKVRRSKNLPEVKLNPYEPFEIYYNILRRELSPEQLKSMQNPHQFDGDLDKSENNQSPQSQAPQSSPDENSDKEEAQMKKMIEALLAKEAELEKQKQVAQTPTEVVTQQKELVSTQEKINEFMKKLELTDLVPKSEQLTAAQRELAEKMEQDHA